MEWGKRKHLSVTFSFLLISCSYSFFLSFFYSSVIVLREGDTEQSRAQTDPATLAVLQDLLIDVHVSTHQLTDGINIL
jgi:hypothetical protein